MGAALAALRSYLLASLPAALRTLSAEELVALANRLALTFGRTDIAPTTTAIMAAIRQWIADNPKTAYVIANIVGNIGLGLLDDYLTSALKEEEDSEIAKAGYTALQKRLREYRAAHTGDGKLETINGDTGHSGMNNQEQLEAEKMIETAIQIIGNPELFMTLRNVMFMEDADIEKYILSRY